ncbi:hypothetical protein HOY80DRAFT_985855 [Tuber brumale]|nr:hypothetical protein HOY80DRAFT_985855 [Tuber brumale]
MYLGISVICTIPSAHIMVLSGSVRVELSTRLITVDYAMCSPSILYCTVALVLYSTTFLSPGNHGTVLYLIDIYHELA